MTQDQALAAAQEMFEAASVERERRIGAKPKDSYWIWAGDKCVGTSMNSWDEALAFARSKSTGTIRKPGAPFEDDVAHA